MNRASRDLVAVLLIGGLLGAACAPRGEVKLSWTPPTERMDGTRLGDLESYRIAWSDQPGGPYDDGERVIRTKEPRAVISGLKPGRYCFVVYARDRAGQESDPSPEACKTIDGRARS